MRNVVTKKFIAVVVAAAMVLASGVAVPVKAASDVTEGKDMENWPRLVLDTPVTVTEQNHQFAFTADEDGYYRFAINGGEGCKFRLFNSRTYDENTEFENSIGDNIHKGDVVYVDCQPVDKECTLMITCLKIYELHDWNDVESVDFYPLREVYVGIDDFLNGLGAKVTFSDGKTFEYDGLYSWRSYEGENSWSYYEEEETEQALFWGWEGKWDSATNSYKFNFGKYISITVSGPIKEDHTPESGDFLDLTEEGELCLKINDTPGSNCPIDINDTVKIKVVDSPVKSIEPFGVLTTINADSGKWIEDKGYMLYSPRIDGIIVTYEDGTKDVLTGAESQPNDGIKASMYVDTAPVGHGAVANRNQIDIITNQETAHWEKEKTYPVTVTYMGVEAQFQCTIGDMYRLDENDLQKCVIEIRNEKMFLNHIDNNSLLKVTKDDIALVQGRDYEILGWYQVLGNTNWYASHYSKLKEIPTELGSYRIALLGKGQYKGAVAFDYIDVTDTKDLTAYHVKEKETITVSNIKDIDVSDFVVSYDFSDEEHVELTPDVDYSFDGWYVREYDEDLELKETEVSEFAEGRTYYAKLSGKGAYEGFLYLRVHIRKEEELPQSPTPTAELVQTPEISGGSTSGGSSSSETTPTAAPTITPVPSQTPGAASGPAVSTGPAITPGEDTKPTEPTAAPETSDEPSTQTPTPSEPTQAPDNNDDDEKNEPQATTATVNKSGVKATVKTTENGTAAVKNVKSNKKSVTVSSTVEVEGVEYKVTVIEANAFANCKKATKITLPSTVKKIKKKAFTGAKKVKTIIVKSKKAVTVKKGAFKGINTEKITIKASKMSKKQLKKFKKILKKAGFKGKIKK